MKLYNPKHPQGAPIKGYSFIENEFINLECGQTIDLPIDTGTNLYETYPFLQIVSDEKVLEPEAALISEKEELLQEKEGTVSPDQVAETSPFTCSVCNKGFKTKIGLLGHGKTHK